MKSREKRPNEWDEQGKKEKKWKWKHRGLEEKWKESDRECFGDLNKNINLAQAHRRSIQTRNKFNRDMWKIWVGHFSARYDIMYFYIYTHPIYLLSRPDGSPRFTSSKRSLSVLLGDQFYFIFLINSNYAISTKNENEISTRHRPIDTHTRTTEDFEFPQSPSWMKERNSIQNMCQFILICASHPCAVSCLHRCNHSYAARKPADL